MNKEQINEELIHAKILKNKLETDLYFVNKRINELENELAGEFE